MGTRMDTQILHLVAQQSGSGTLGIGSQGRLPNGRPSGRSKGARQPAEAFVHWWAGSLSRPVDPGRMWRAGLGAAGRRPSSSPPQTLWGELTPTAHFLARMLPSAMQALSWGHLHSFKASLRHGPGALASNGHLLSTPSMPIFTLSAINSLS